MMILAPAAQTVAPSLLAACHSLILSPILAWVLPSLYIGMFLALLGVGMPLSFLKPRKFA